MRLRKNTAARFKAGMGAESIKELLERIDLEKLSKELKEELETVQGQKKGRIIKRLEIVEAFRLSHNRPEWMILTVDSDNSAGSASDGAARWRTFRDL